MKKAQELSASQQEELLGILKTRFEKHKKRHPNILWNEVYAKLKTNLKAMWSLNEMELSGGEPDVIEFDDKNGAFVFCDCSAESPKGRRSLCYDREAWEARKEHRPENNAMDIANEMGIELLTADEYRALQKLEAFDAKTSSWLKTPPEIRKLEGAIFGDFRFNTVFIYHNGAQSYYAARGFRGLLRV